MRSVWVVAWVTGLVLTASNFLFQSVMAAEWGVAAERSLFQLVAVLVVAGNARAWNAR